MFYPKIVFFHEQLCATYDFCQISIYGSKNLEQKIIIKNLQKILDNFADKFKGVVYLLTLLCNGLKFGAPVSLKHPATYLPKGKGVGLAAGALLRHHTGPNLDKI